MSDSHRSQNARRINRHCTTGIRWISIAYLRRCAYIFVAVLCAIGVDDLDFVFAGHYTWAIESRALILAGRLRQRLRRRRISDALDLREKNDLHAACVHRFLFCRIDGPDALRHAGFSDRHANALNMSLKAFHLIFVTLLTSLSFGFAAWAFRRRRPFSARFGIVAGILVIIYGIYFLKKLKKISYL